MKEITAALVAFHKEMPTIKKNSVNPFFKSSYASLPDILDAIDPLLVKHGLAVVQVPTDRHQLKTILLHTSGESIEGTYEMTPKDESPQGIGSTITYARRYALAAMLSLNIDEDDDGNAGSTTPPPKADAAPDLATEKQRGMIYGLYAKKTGSEMAEAEKEKIRSLSKTRASELIEMWMSQLAEKPAEGETDPSQTKVDWSVRAGELAKLKHDDMADLNIDEFLDKTPVEDDR